MNETARQKPAPPEMGAGNPRARLKRVTPEKERPMNHSAEK